MARMINEKGEELYFNDAQKNGKTVYVLKGIGETLIIGRDRQKRKSRIFTQYAQAEAYLNRHGFKTSYYWERVRAANKAAEAAGAATT